MSLHPLNRKDVKAFVEVLEKAFGFTGPFDYTLFVKDEAKYYLATRDVDAFHDKKWRVERIGIYLGEIAHGELRLSIEGSQLIGPYATHHVVTLTAKQRDDWMLGKDVVLDGVYPQQFHIVTCEGDFLGSGKYKNGVLLNYVPKERYVGATFTDEDIPGE